eukprot:9481405-Alexandrium_andersonii.AAC.1
MRTAKLDPLGGNSGRKPSVGGRTSRDACEESLVAPTAGSKAGGASSGGKPRPDRGPAARTTRG